MDNISIKINGDVYFTVLCDDFNDCFEEEELEAEALEEESGDRTDPKIYFSVSGIPNNIDRCTAESIIESVTQFLGAALEKNAKNREGRSHE